MSIDTLLDRSNASSKTVTIPQIRHGDAAFDSAQFDIDALSGGQLVRRFDRVDRRSENIQFKFYTENANRYFLLHSVSLMYQVGAEVN